MPAAIPIVREQWSEAARPRQAEVIAPNFQGALPPIAQSQPARPQPTPFPQVARAPRAQVRRVPTPAVTAPVGARATSRPTAGISPEILAAVEIKAASLDESDYFQVLEVTADADQRQIRDAYHRFSRDLHPDRFRHFPDGDLRERAGRLFKRITEAYYVLRDDARRAQYSADVSGPARAQKLRYSDESESQKQATRRRAILEQTGSTPRGRECYQLALREQAAGRWPSAIRQLKMALMYEPQNELFREKLQEAEEAVKAER